MLEVGAGPVSKVLSTPRGVVLHRRFTDPLSGEANRPRAIRTTCLTFTSKGTRDVMSDIEHKVVVVSAELTSGEALEAHLHQHERQGWELTATLPNPDGRVSLVFKRPRPLLGAPDT